MTRALSGLRARGARQRLGDAFGQLLELALPHLILARLRRHRRDPGTELAVTQSGRETGNADRSDSNRRRDRDLERASGDAAPPGQHDRLLERLERRSAQCPGEGSHFSPKCPALDAAGQVAIDERLLDAREVAVQPEGDPLPELIATVPYFCVRKGHIQCDERIAVEVRSLRKTFLIIGDCAENE